MANDLLELIKERDALNKKIEEAKDKGKPKMRAFIEEKLAEFGWSIEDIFPEYRKISTRTKVPPKFMNPDNPADIWTGQGNFKNPKKWVAKIVEREGISVQDFKKDKRFKITAKRLKEWQETGK